MSRVNPSTVVVQNNISVPDAVRDISNQRATFNARRVNTEEFLSSFANWVLKLNFKFASNNFCFCENVFFCLERFEVEQVVSWSQKVDEKVSMERPQLENGIFGCSI